ncbi:MAG: Hsp70 family protein [Rhodobacteraceae bacterium]|nr:Hsp70 family protein [Paracoccaceae bacterium]
MRLGIDFGTSNTAAAVMAGGKPYVIPLESSERTLPTAVFFDPRKTAPAFGHAAVRALIDGREGRFMRALKSVLGTSLMHEKRIIGGEKLTLIEVIARFLSHVKTQAEAHCGQEFDSVLSGRPVQFHSRDAARNAQAPLDLEQAYRLAGFTSVAFLPEPEAAAYASGGADGGLALIVDIGGGTSDFTLFRGAPGAIEVLASHGVRIGGTDFDRALNLAHVMPLLGMGTEIRNEFGPDSHTAPQAIFHDLATWEKIPFLYTGETRRAVARMAKMAQDRVAFDRLVEVLVMELGHDLSFAVERGKIAANAPEPGWGMIDLRVVEQGLAARLTRDRMITDLADLSSGIVQTAADAVTGAGFAPTDITKVILVGGSSLMGVVEQSMRDLFPQAAIDRSDAFTAVVDGLAIAAAT